MEKIKILAVYRGRIFEHRGTPIRVRSLLTQLNSNDYLDLAVCSWDKTQGNFSKHFTLTNNHFQDIKQIYHYIKNNKIDVVIGHTVATSYYLVPLKLLTRAKIILDMHGLVEDEAREYGDIGLLRYWLLKLWYGFFYWTCDLITTCSQSVTDILLKYNRHTVTMCGGVDLSLFNPNVPSGGYIKKDGRIIIGYAGNARTWQGVDFLVEVYKKLSIHHNDFKLAMLMSEKWGEDMNLEIIGPLPNEDVPKFLIDCDILVIPRPLTSVAKISFPSKLPEYLAMGKAVIVSNTGDMDKVITSGINGLLYTPGNAEELMNNLLALRDKNLRERLGAEAVKTAQQLSWERLADFLVDNIRKIV